MGAWLLTCINLEPLGFNKSLSFSIEEEGNITDQAVFQYHINSSWPGQYFDGQRNTSRSIINTPVSYSHMSVLNYGRQDVSHKNTV
jgi:hypothetical protein